MNKPIKLSKQELKDALEKHVGLIPIKIDVEKREIIWSDLGEYHFYEGFFHKSLEVYFNLNKNRIIAYSSDIDTLLDKTLLKKYVYPSGFIFHLGRSGSTLLSKILARNRNHLVISEAAPLNQIWEILKEINDMNKLEEFKIIYQNLLLSMLRHRLKSHKYSFIKFTSYNIHFFQYINDIFPDVPAIFLYKEPNEVISSFAKNPSGILNLSNKTLAFFTGIVNPNMESIVQKQISEAFEIQDDKLKRVKFESLIPENLILFCQYFNVEINPNQLKTMITQFKFDSKVDFNKKEFC
jgi:hypothetical protein